MKPTGKQVVSRSLMKLLAVFGGVMVGILVCATMPIARFLLNSLIILLSAITIEGGTGL